ncbi:hypothetical protein BH24ACT5_BH24ACT5_24880 [soil metagenome]
MFRRLIIASAAVCALAASTVSPAMALGYAHGKVVSADPVDFTPHVQDGTVLAVAVVADRVYVGGTFTTVVNAGTSTKLVRNYLFAFDRATGRVLDFAPSLDGAVETIAPAPDGASIIIGGRFKTVQGTAQRSLAMLAPNGTRVSSFAARTNGYVKKIVVRGNRLFAGGRFSTANGVARANLAAFDATAGKLDTLFTIDVSEGRTKSNGTVTKPSVYELDADADGSRLVVIGNFRQVAAQQRMQVAMIDLTNSTLSSWYTTRYPNDVSGSLGYQCSQVFDTQMRDVEFSPDGSYFVVVTTGGAPDRNTKSLCDTAARWETTAKLAVGEKETWYNCTGGDTLLSVAVTARAGLTSDGAVYVGGHQRWLDNCGGRDNAVPGSFAADGIGAIDANTGKAIRDWNPGRTRGVGAEELVADAEGLYIGSDTEELGGEYHARLGLFPLN